MVLSVRDNKQMNLQNKIRAWETRLADEGKPHLPKRSADDTMWQEAQQERGQRMLLHRGYATDTADSSGLVGGSASGGALSQAGAAQCEQVGWAVGTIV
jgi:hypothetical protein